MIPGVCWNFHINPPKIENDASADFHLAFLGSRNHPFFHLLPPPCLSGKKSIVDPNIFSKFKKQKRFSTMTKGASWVMDRLVQLRKRFGQEKTKKNFMNKALQGYDRYMAL